MIWWILGGYLLAGLITALRWAYIDLEWFGYDGRRVWWEELALVFVLWPLFVIAAAVAYVWERKERD